MPDNCDILPAESPADLVAAAKPKFKCQTWAPNMENDSITITPRNG